MRGAALLSAGSIVACTIVAGCSGSGGERPVVVGSKKFTESVVLGELAAARIAVEGVPTRHRRELGGTRVLWEALRAGEIDVYPEYTGTIREEILAGERVARGRDALQEALAAHGVVAMPALGFDNTYALALREDRAAELDVRTVSDLLDHPDLSFGVTAEFLERGDGWPALVAAYGLPHRDVRGLDHDIAYEALVTGAVDVMDVYSTDAQIEALGLRVLEDDRGHFPEYAALFLRRADLAERAPAAVAALASLGSEGVELDAATMRRLNARAAIDRIPEARVAARFLREAAGVEVTARVESKSSRLARHAVEHLALVAVSLSAAIATAVPAGIVAARRPRWGHLVIGAAGVVQTIPSLALLVLFVPLLGIGAEPAIAALFAYSLLPIVRNTHAGLVGLPRPLRDSAESLGLSPRARLLSIDLPLALPSILAGIKIAAVLNVGTATLGALVGAGGFGEPILTGIRLRDTELILLGALPAAALALAASAAFDLAERRLVSRGLRA